VTEQDDDDLRRRLQELERLLRDMEAGPESPVRTRARQIVHATLDLHGRALTRMLEIVAAPDATGSSLGDAFARDPLVAGMLLLHGLHPVDLETRVRSTVEALGPRLRGQGAEITLVAVTEGAVELRIERSASAGGAPIAALRTRAEEAILAAAPDAASVKIDVPDDNPRAGFVPLEQVRLRSRGPVERRS
jgi:hypothetical protein